MIHLRNSFNLRVILFKSQNLTENSSIWELSRPSNNTFNLSNDTFKK